MRWQQRFSCNTRSRARADRHRASPCTRRGRTRIWITWALAILSACAANSGRAVRVTIPAGSSLGAAADSLARVGVIRSSRLFRLYALIRGGGRPIRGGTYMLHRNSGYGATLDDIRGGKGLVHTVTIPEGFSLSQIIPLFASRLSLSPESLAVAVRDTALLHELDVPTETVEGYVFPDTYIFPDRTSARAAIDAGVKRFEKIWEPSWTARLDTVGLSRNDVMAIASIVEKEARLPEERPVIAAVYLNRLRDHMLLQADPTVQYALGTHQNRVYYKDLEVESQYNTYKHPGLPPGPIASPGRASIVAALYPANVPFKYFVAFPDGHHEFRTDFAGHETARNLARRAWDSLATRSATGWNDTAHRRTRPR